MFGAKTSSQTDQRVAATDQALVMQPGGLMFNPGRGSDDTQLAALGGSAGAITPKAALWPLVILAGLAAAVVIFIYWRRK